MEAKVIITTELQLKAIVADAVGAALKYYKPEQILAPFTSASPTDEILTIQQAAKLLNLTTQTIYGLVSARKIPFSKPTGSRLYFSRLELLDWLKSTRTATVEEQKTQYSQNGKNRKGGRKAE